MWEVLNESIVRTASQSENRKDKCLFHKDQIKLLFSHSPSKLVWMPSVLCPGAVHAHSGSAAYIGNKGWPPHCASTFPPERDQCPPADHWIDFEYSSIPISPQALFSSSDLPQAGHRGPPGHPSSFLVLFWCNVARSLSCWKTERLLNYPFIFLRILCSASQTRLFCLVCWPFIPVSPFLEASQLALQNKLSFSRLSACLKSASLITAPLPFLETGSCYAA